MKKIKESKRLKAILFFGFYLIFFSILFLGWKEKNVSVKEKDNVSTSFNISTIANSNYQYHFLINDSGILKEYRGTKEEKSTCEKGRKAREYYSFPKSALRKPSTESDLQQQRGILSSSPG